MGRCSFEWACPWTRLHIFDTTSWIYSVRSSMEFSRPVISWSFVHLPHMGLPMCQKLIKHKDFVEPISRKPLNVFSPFRWLSARLHPLLTHLSYCSLALSHRFEVLWNCPDLQLYYVMVFRSLVPRAVNSLSNRLMDAVILRTPSCVSCTCLIKYVYNVPCVTYFSWSFVKSILK